MSNGPVGKSRLSIIRFINISFTVCASCDWDSRITHKDEGLVVTPSESPCELVVRSIDDRQVVAVMYNTMPVCITKGRVEVRIGINIYIRVSV